MVLKIRLMELIGFSTNGVYLEESGCFRQMKQHEQGRGKTQGISSEQS